MRVFSVPRKWEASERSFSGPEQKQVFFCFFFSVQGTLVIAVAAKPLVVDDWVGDYTTQGIGDCNHPLGEFRSQPTSISWNDRGILNTAHMGMPPQVMEDHHHGLGRVSTLTFTTIPSRSFVLFVGVRSGPSVPFRAGPENSHDKHIPTNGVKSSCLDRNLLGWQ